MNIRILLRPVCWLRGHNAEWAYIPQIGRYIVCARCNKVAWHLGEQPRPRLPFTQGRLGP